MIRLELTPAEAAALLSELVKPRGGMEQPQHDAAVTSAGRSIAGALETWAHAGAPGLLPLKHAPAAPANGKKPRGRPSNESKAAAAAAAAPPAGKPSTHPRGTLDCGNTPGGYVDNGIRPGTCTFCDRPLSAHVSAPGGGK